MIFLWVALGAAAVVLGSSLILLVKALRPRVIPFQKTYEIEVEKGKLVEEDYNSWPREDFTFPSDFGYDLAGSYFPLEGSQKTVVLVHGYIYSRLGMVKYIPIFRKRGFNTLIFDNRYHGLSGGNSLTYGFYEKFDLQRMLDWAEKRLDPGGVLGLFGESLGASTVVMEAAMDARPAFVIADCGYADLREILGLRLRQDYHLPEFPLLPLANLFMLLLAGFKVEQVCPLEDIQRVQTPVFLIHGQDDDYIPAHHSQRMYAAKTHGLRRLYLAPNASHAEAFWNNQTEYDQQVGEFLDEIGLG